MKKKLKVDHVYVLAVTSEIFLVEHQLQKLSKMLNKKKALSCLICLRTFSEIEE